MTSKKNPYILAVKKSAEMNGSNGDHLDHKHNEESTKKTPVNDFEQLSNLSNQKLDELRAMNEKDIRSTEKELTINQSLIDRMTAEETAINQFLEKQRVSEEAYQVAVKREIALQNVLLEIMVDHFKMSKAKVLSQITDLKKAADELSKQLVSFEYKYLSKQLPTEVICRFQIAQINYKPEAVKTAQAARKKQISELLNTYGTPKISDLKMRIKSGLENANLKTIDLIKQKQSQINAGKKLNAEYAMRAGHTNTFMAERALRDLKNMFGKYVNSSTNLKYGLTCMTRLKRSIAAKAQDNIEELHKLIIGFYGDRSNEQLAPLCKAVIVSLQELLQKNQAAERTNYFFKRNHMESMLNETIKEVQAMQDYYSATPTVGPSK